MTNKSSHPEFWEMFGRPPQSLIKSILLGVLFFQAILFLPETLILENADVLRQAKAVDLFNSDAQKPISYEVPETNVGELTKFMTRVMGYQPSSREEMSTHRTKAFRALSIAADRILELESNKTSYAYHLAIETQLSKRLIELNGDARSDIEHIIRDLQAHLTSREPKQADRSLAMFAANRVLALGSLDLATKSLNTSAAVFTKSKNRNNVHFGHLLTGTARRLNLFGNSMELVGTTLDGQEFDLTSYHGKVVLVNFWATWCGPCIHELPELKHLYHTYHERGFDIVGICIDRRRSTLDRFIKAHPMPWKNLHNRDTGDTFSSSVEYGVTAAPTMFLVGRDGKVVSLNARGQYLRQLLFNILGPPG